jgi:hypothetical protein
MKRRYPKLVKGGKAMYTQPTNNKQCDSFARCAYLFTVHTR